ncbi:mitochondrial 2-oxoglutarate/malate carrier protein-like isoform X1 [Maniola jurtina]|uniref:mitochondrial 2-oxoglutarate/malate carrier protein-like isoform X1 n=1 Tax=Maniola jurtina TaxID=191418 RepID=UPI001E68DA55|nr:mitochondrial 2-oxoglutarate/malate carrier protein-like isoform X1 [Maniola jurtina]
MPLSVRDPPVKRKVPWHVAMVLGGMAGMVATTVVHPLDVIKVRLQLFPRSCSTLEMASAVVRCRGGAALYTGLSAGLLRQTTYTTTRLAVYHALIDVFRREYNQEPILYQKLVISTTAGLCGALAGTPSEVALVRMMADGPLEPCIACNCPRLYRGTFDALYKICTQEGMGALWRGGTLTLGRSVLVSICQVWSYTQVREEFRERKLAKGLSLHIYASFISSFLTAFVSLPIDLVKTRYQVKHRGLTQREIFSDIVHRKGALYFWKGFVPYYIRMAIHTIVALLVFDELHQLYEDTKRS